LLLSYAVILFLQKEMDEDFEERQKSLSNDLWSTLKDQMSKEEFHAMLASFRNQEEGRKAVRAGR
jgi:hypothetical protein